MRWRMQELLREEDSKQLKQTHVPNEKPENNSSMMPITFAYHPFFLNNMFIVLYIDLTLLYPCWKRTVMHVLLWLNISISVHIYMVYHLRNCNQSLNFVSVSFYNASKTVIWFFCSLLAGDLSVFTVPRSLFPSIKSILVEDSHLIMGRPKHPELASLATAFRPLPSPCQRVTSKHAHLTQRILTGRMSHLSEAHKSNQPHMTPLSTHLVFSQWRLGVQFTVLIGNPGFS